MNSDKIIKAQLDAYRPNFLEHGDKPQGTFQNNSETQQLRFERIIRQFNLQQNKFSIQDIGCGTCDLHQYLLDKKIEHKYCGVEIVPEMIETARKKFPEITLNNYDLIKDKNIPLCDITVLSGTLNLLAGVSESEWKDFSFSLIKRMFELSKVGISFNLLTSHRTFSDPTLAYFNPAEIFDFCVQNLSRFVLLDHAYPLYEFSVTVFHKEHMRNEFNNEAFQKYLK
jgi:hypothetical protein